MPGAEFFPQPVMPVAGAATPEIKRFAGLVRHHPVRVREGPAPAAPIQFSAEPHRNSTFAILFAGISHPESEGSEALLDSPPFSKSRQFVDPKLV